MDDEMPRREPSSPSGSRRFVTRQTPMVEEPDGERPPARTEQSSSSPSSDSTSSSSSESEPDPPNHPPTPQPQRQPQQTAPGLQSGVEPHLTQPTTSTSNPSPQSSPVSMGPGLSSGSKQLPTLRRPPHRQSDPSARDRSRPPPRIPSRTLNVESLISSKVKMQTMFTLLT